MLLDILALGDWEAEILADSEAEMLLETEALGL